jgi:hypothetical protein
MSRLYQDLMWVVFHSDLDAYLDGLYCGAHVFLLLYHILLGDFGDERC